MHPSSPKRAILLISMMFLPASFKGKFASWHRFDNSVQKQITQRINNKLIPARQCYCLEARWRMPLHGSSVMEQSSFEISLGKRSHVFQPGIEAASEYRIDYRGTVNTSYRMTDRTHMGWHTASISAFTDYECLQILTVWQSVWHFPNKFSPYYIESAISLTNSVLITFIRAFD